MPAADALASIDEVDAPIAGAHVADEDADGLAADSAINLIASIAGAHAGVAGAPDEEADALASASDEEAAINVIW